MRLLVSDLIAIGVTLGVEAAERVYRALAHEPIDAQGARVDLTVILAHVARAKCNTTLVNP